MAADDPADSVSGDDPLLGSQMAPFCCVLTWWKLRYELRGLFLSKGTDLTPEGSTPWPHDPPEGSHFRTSHQGLGFQATNSLGNEVQGVRETTIQSVTVSYGGLIKGSYPLSHCADGHRHPAR